MGCGSWWNPVRDTIESGAVLAGNYALPGSALLTDNLVSKGSKDQLNSTVGKVAQIGTGLAGAGVGSSVTGIPSAGAVGAGWGNLASAAGGAASSIGASLGITDAATAAGEAAPWVNPDIAALGSGADASSTAAPWVNPDVAVSPGASAASAAPWVNPDLAANVDEFGNPIAAASGGGAPVNPNNLTAGEANLLGRAAGEASSPIAAGAGNTFTNTVVPAAQAAGAGNSLWNSVKNNLGPIVSGAGLAASALKDSKPLPAEGALNTQAAASAASADQLKNYLPSGTLPPGAQAGIDQAKNSAKASIRSKYASMGMSGSSSEQQELSAIDSNAQAQGEALALQLLNSGISESTLSSQLYENILNGQLEQDKNLSSSIGNFASSLAGAARNPSTTGA